MCDCMTLPRGPAPNATSTSPTTAAAAAATNRPGLLPLLQQQQQMQQSVGGGVAGSGTVGSAGGCSEAVARVCRLAPGGPGCAALHERQEQLQQWQEQLGAGAVGGSGGAVWGESPLRVSPYLQVGRHRHVEPVFMLHVIAGSAVQIVFALALVLQYAYYSNGACPSTPSVISQHPLQALCPELASNGSPANATGPPLTSTQPGSGNSTNSAPLGSNSSSIPAQQQQPAPKFPCVCAYLGLASPECFSAVLSYCPQAGTGAPSARRSMLHGGQGGGNAGVKAGGPTEGLGWAGWSRRRALRQQADDSGPLCAEALPVLAAAYGSAQNGTGVSNVSAPAGVDKVVSAPDGGASVSSSLSGGQLRAVYGQLRDTCFPGAVSAPSYCNCGVVSCHGPNHGRQCVPHRTAPYSQALLTHANAHAT